MACNTHSLPSMEPLRESWVDAAKGMVIIAVVVFHSGAIPRLDDFMQWVMMPSFFMVAGYLYHPKEGYFKKRAKRLLLPLLVAIVIIYFIFGGDGLFTGEGQYVVLWFLPCLFLVQIGFSYIRPLLFPYKVTIILACFIAAHYIPHVLPPWGIDAPLAALYYYAIGFYAKKYFQDRKLAIICLLAILPFIVAQHWRLAYNSLDMKHLYFPNIYFDAFVPVICSILLFNLAQLFSGANLLRRIGKSSMIIYLFHANILMNFDLSKYFQPMMAKIILIVLAIIVPFAASLLWNEISKLVSSYHLDELHNMAANQMKIGIINKLHKFWK
jgi:fucose 4-O-acetylase-like acetyltransferase